MLQPIFLPARQNRLASPRGYFYRRKIRSVEYFPQSGGDKLGCTNPKQYNCIDDFNKFTIRIRLGKIATCPKLIGNLSVLIQSGSGKNDNRYLAEGLIGPDFGERL